MLQETVEQLKQLVGQSTASDTKTGDDDADGWDCEDDRESAFDIVLFVIL